MTTCLHNVTTSGLPIYMDVVVAVVAFCHRPYVGIIDNACYISACSIHDNNVRVHTPYIINRGRSI